MTTSIQSSASLIFVTMPFKYWKYQSFQRIPTSALNESFPYRPSTIPEPQPHSALSLQVYLAAQNRWSKAIQACQKQTPEKQALTLGFERPRTSGSSKTRLGTRLCGCSHRQPRAWQSRAETLKFPALTLHLMEPERNEPAKAEGRQAKATRSR